MKNLKTFSAFVTVLFLLESCKKDTSSSPPLEFVPAISSFSPGSGPAGTIVTITGTNFSSITTDNTVSFNGTPATVTSATSTQIITTVPPGATTGKITVKVSTKTTTSSGNFTVSVAANQLSIARTFIAAATLGNKIYFGGGFNGTATVKTIDIYDASTGSWSTSQLSVARENMAAAAAGHKIVFAGGQTNNDYASSFFSSAVDIYDDVTGLWSTASLSNPQTYINAGAAGNKILFGGGLSAPISETVDIYDVSANTWSTHRLPTAKIWAPIAGAGTKILIAGGVNVNSTSNTDEYYKTVDIYDVNTNSWTQAELSEARDNMGVVSIGNKIIFAGGNTKDTSYNFVPSKTVDIYDVTTNTWTTTQMSEAVVYSRLYATFASSGNKIFLTRGMDIHPDGSGEISDRVEIYDISTNTWTMSHLSAARANAAAGSASNKILFAGGFNGNTIGPFTTVDIYDVLNGKWTN
ncbi:MAG: kelch repeat-containing protein [Chitinophagaceae bacterium]